MSQSANFLSSGTSSSQSTRLLFVNDLADALGGLQDHVAAHEARRRLAESIAQGDPFCLQGTLQWGLHEHDDQINIELEADSQFSISEEGVEPSFHDIELPDVDWAKHVFEPVFHLDGEVVVSVEAFALARVKSTSAFPSGMASTGKACRWVTASSQLTSESCLRRS
jgi:hypothetical protein